LFNLRFSLLISLFVLCISVSVLSTTPDDFEKANNLFKEKKYLQSIELYHSILQQGHTSPSLYFNIGNAYFKIGDLGHAILYYMKAKRLDPGDNDISANLEFAKQFTSIQMEGVQLNPISNFLASLVEHYHLNVLAWISSFFFILLILSLSVRYILGFTGSAIRTSITLILILLIISSMLTTYKYRYDYLTDRAVIVAEECTVTTGPSKESDIELEAAAGLIVEIISESGDYYNILFENKRRGWIKKDLVSLI